MLLFQKYYNLNVTKIKMKKTLQCPECKNDITFEKEYKLADVIECPFCGIELEVTEVSKEGDLKVEIIEEEK